MGYTSKVVKCKRQDNLLGAVRVVLSIGPRFINGHVRH